MMITTAMILCLLDYMKSFSSFLKNCSRFNYNYGASPGMLLKSNMEIMEDSDFSVHGDLEDIDFSQTNIQVQGVDESSHVRYINHDIQSCFQVKVCKHILPWNVN